MIRNTDRLREFEARYARTAWRDLTLSDALAIYEGMVREARLLRPDFGEDWQHHLEADLAIGRAINGLPPAS